MPATSRLLLEARRGDPFLGAVFKGIASLGGRVFNALLPRPSTPAVRTAAPSVPGGGSPTGQVGTAQMVRAVIPAIARSQFGSTSQTRVTTMPDFSDVRSGASSRALAGGRRRRRMNPANIRALRRSISRVTSFERLASRVLHLTRRGVSVKGFKRRTRRKR